MSAVPPTAVSDDGAPPSRTERGRVLLVFLVLLSSYGYLFPRLNNWESNSGMDLIYAPADQGPVRIDDYLVEHG